MPQCSIKISVLIILLVELLVRVDAVSSAAPSMVCDNLLDEGEVASLFKQNVLRQLALEFGESGLFVYELQQSPVDAVITRLEAYAKYKKLGQTGLATLRVKGWVSRCEGTTMIRDNTWLADGTLVTQRYMPEQLPGKGVQLGDKNAATHVMVFVDSRCPHCHRLLSYANALIEQGKIFLEIRQVAYLETVEEALQDTRLFDTALIDPHNSTLSISDYVEMLAGFNSERAVKVKNQRYATAKTLIETNTKTAQEVLHIISVPSVLIRELKAKNQYRRTSYWEMNRIFQPDL
ncbi:MAG: thioredoxin domain-containing protein [Gammaproteobacteria bacterium]|nr:thioredoxin domain-containing protein [Gammaproteobacteria bacterium]